LKEIEAGTSKPIESDCTEFTGTMTIRELAERVKLTPRSIRYYEEIGLLTGIMRDRYNRRRYSERDVYVLKLVKRAKHLLGLSLQEIKELAVLSQEAHLDKPLIKRSLEMLADNIKRIEQQEEGLRTTKKILAQEVKRLKSLLSENNEPIRERNKVAN